MAKSKESCTKELKRVMASMAETIGKPYEEAMRDLQNIRKEGKKVLADCTADIKHAFEDACKKLEKMIEASRIGGAGTAEALQQGAKTLYEDALKQLKN